MSRLYETLRRMELQRGKTNPVEIASLAPVDLVNAAMAQPAEIDGAPMVEPEISLVTRLVAITEPRGLAAEKFRALVTRLENKRKEQDVKSLQITSAVAMEGKTLVAGNLAFTLAKHTGSRVLLVEGDLHRPTMASLFGLNQLSGIGHWWCAPEGKDDIHGYICRFKQYPLWFLPAGVTADQPSHILQSARFAEAFSRLAASFDWIVVDSTPILPTGHFWLFARA
jgi:Mrp family chromosome partitioning ATPase